MGFRGRRESSLPDPFHPAVVLLPDFSNLPAKRISASENGAVNGKPRCEQPAEKTRPIPTAWMTPARGLGALNARYAIGRDTGLDLPDRPQSSPRAGKQKASPREAGLSA